MSDFDSTLLHDVLQITGASLRRSIDLSTGEVHDVAVARSARTASGRPLSTSHKTPFVEWTRGARLLKVSGGGDYERKGGGTRGKVKGFTSDARRRLMRTIAKVRDDAGLPDFVTLSYPSSFPEPKESKRHLEMFIKRMKRKFPECGMIWKLEPQQRGAPHYHLLVWGVSQEKLREFVPVAWHDIAGNGDINHLLFHQGLLHDSEPCVNAVRSWKGVMSYASKYLGKTFEVAGWDGKETGRFWAVVNRKNIPFGQDMVMRITVKDAHKWMRYQRRFSGVRFRSSSPSHTTFCDADQWVDNIIKAHGGEPSD